MDRIRAIQRRTLDVIDLDQDPPVRYKSMSWFRSVLIYLRITKPNND